MTYRGHVKGGVVVFDEPVQLPEGTPVRVESAVPTDEPQNGTPSLLDRLGGVVGAAGELPEDAARNVDHYLYGHPKK